jgi:DNA-directed RNA polymerase subunit M/transcription elongation factor TFIIS
MIAPTVDKDSEHTHHWMIATQDGETSNAVCRTCGDKRDFENAYRYSQRWKGATPKPAAAQEEEVNG